MIFKQRDYSRAMNANATSLQAKQQGLQVKQFKEDLAYRKEMQGHQQTIDNVNDVVRSVRAIAGTTMNIYGQYKKVKQADDTQSANSMLFQLGQDADRAIVESPLRGEGAPSYDGTTFDLGSDLTSIRDAQLEQIRAQDWDKDVKEAAIRNLEQSWDARETNILATKTKQYLDDLATTRSDELDAALKMDVEAGSQANGHALIDGYSDMTPAQREHVRYNYDKAYETKRKAEEEKDRINSVIETAADGTLEEALKSVDQMLDSETIEWSEAVNLKNVAVRADALKTSELVEIAGSEFNRLVEQAESAPIFTPGKTTGQAIAIGPDGEEVVEDVGPSMRVNPVQYARDKVLEEAEGIADPKKRKAVKQSVDAQQQAYVASQLSDELTKLLEEPTIEGYSSFKLSIEDGGENAALFYGLDNYRSEVLATVDKQMQTLQTGIDKASAQALADLKDARQTEIDAYTNFFKAGRISAKAAVTMLETVDSKYSEIALDGKVAVAIHDIVTANVPSQFKDLANDSLKRIEEGLKLSMSVSDYDTPEEYNLAVQKASNGAWEAMLDFFQSVPEEALTRDIVAERMGQIEGQFSMTVISELEKMDEKYAGSTVTMVDEAYDPKMGPNGIPQAAFTPEWVPGDKAPEDAPWYEKAWTWLTGKSGHFKLNDNREHGLKLSKDYGKTIDLLAKAPPITVNAQGGYQFGSEQYDNAYLRLEQTGTLILDKMGETVLYTKPQESQEEGKFLNVPVFYTESGNAFTLDKENIYSEDGKIVRSITDVLGM